MLTSAHAAVCEAVAGSAQPACRGHVGEGAVAIVPQQRVALGQLPPAAQHEDVLAAVVVVVGLNQVQPAQLTVEPGCGRSLGERAIPVVAEVVQGSATVEVGGDDVVAPGAGEIIDDDTSGRGYDIQAGLRSHVAETPDVFRRHERCRRNQIRGRNPVRIPTDGHVGEVEKPPHLEVVGLLLQEIQEVFDGSFRVSGFRVRLTRAQRQQADVTWRAMDAVLHTGLVQVCDTQRFQHPRCCGGHAGTGSLEGLLILDERAIHPAVVRVELSQPEVGLHDVERRSRRASIQPFTRQEIFERPLRRCQRLAAHLADRAGILVPVGGFGKGLEDRLCFHESAHVDHVFHIGRCRQAGGIDGVHVDVDRIGVVNHLQDGESRRDLNDWSQLPGRDTHKGVFQHRRQGRQCHLAQEASRTPGRIDRFGLGQGDEVFAVIQPCDDAQCFFYRVDDDDSQCDVV